MPTERVQRQIDALLDEAEAAIKQSDWPLARDRAQNALALDPDNDDARTYLVAADRATAGASPQPGQAVPVASPGSAPKSPASGPGPWSPASASPTAFCDGRYEVKQFLGEGGKKYVYLAHDTLLDRDVAFALIQTDGLDDVGRERIRREAQAMGRLGTHPHVVSVFDLGETGGQPFIVTELMSGGDVEGMIENAPLHRVPLAEALRVADEVCLGLDFAHAQHIVHRDLKPGNVWLAADGTAKIGDFGLAVATDRARLTQAGLMVGTVSYMPPEQAMGGEVTPRSDLYSLGAMLYELVTGRPPFVGDESVAIITQHLNTPPVAPSWHAPEIPPGLEALILRLLEKDPNKRPASANEVRQMLASVLAPTPTPPPTLGEAQTGADSSPLPKLGEGPGVRADSPIYRRTFVGREQELRQLQGAFDTAISGQGSLAMVVGEPGIGKTSICEQLATYVAVRGGKALVGHCYEEGSLSLPYLPFVEAMRTYVLARDPEGLKQDLGSGAAEVARIVSEVRDRLPIDSASQPSTLGPALSASPEDDRWRLLQAVTGFLRNAAAAQPLLIVLEDLHDADRGTLDLLLHVSRNLVGARVLIVGTYRDVEVDRAHPLSAALAELRRAAAFLRIPLRGLTVDEVQRMMNLIRGQDVPWSRAEAIHRQTEGNPLFVQEVLRYLVEEGLVVREGDRYVRHDDGLPDAGIPEGLRDVVGRRLSRLSERANQVLSVAAVIGREFHMDVLQRVVNLSEDEVVEALEEAQGRAVIEERSAVAGALVFRFTHAFFRQTLYEEIFAARRIRWHQQVARALEAVHARRLDDHAAELAEHFSHSSDPADLTKAVAYAELAAKRAMSVYAYGEAVRHWGQALKAQDVLDPDDKARRCDLLLSLGGAMLPLEEPRRIAPTVAEEAFILAEAIGDSLRAARAAVLALDAIVRADGAVQRNATTGTATYQTWSARADRHAQPGTAERVYADRYRGSADMAAVGPAAGHVYFRRAIDRALELGDNAVVFAAAGGPLGYLNALRDQDLVERLAREIRDRSHDGIRASDLGICLHYAAIVLLRCGDRAGAEALWRELAQLVERTRDASLTVLAMFHPADLAFLDGRVEEAITLIEAADARGQDLGVVGTLASAWRLRVYVGRGVADALAALQAPSRPMQGRRAVILAYLGRHEEARAIREQFAALDSDDDETSFTILVNLLDAALLGRDVETVRALARRLAPMAGRLATFSGSIGRYLGASAALLGKPDEARAYYQQALDLCTQVRFRPEIALIHLHLAELHLDQALTPTLSQREREQAQTETREHLDFAIAEFGAMKMQPYLERALRHKGLLRA